MMNEYSVVRILVYKEQKTVCQVCLLDNILLYYIFYTSPLLKLHLQYHQIYDTIDEISSSSLYKNRHHISSPPHPLQFSPQVTYYI
jgi:hypothetical protein